MWVEDRRVLGCFSSCRPGRAGGLRSLTEHHLGRASPLSGGVGGVLCRAAALRSLMLVHTDAGATAS